MHGVGMVSTTGMQRPSANLSDGLPRRAPIARGRAACLPQPAPLHPRGRRLGGIKPMLLFIQKPHQLCIVDTVLLQQGFDFAGAGGGQLLVVIAQQGRF